MKSTQAPSAPGTPAIQELLRDLGGARIYRDVAAALAAHLAGRVACERAALVLVVERPTGRRLAPLASWGRDGLVRYHDAAPTGGLAPEFVGLVRDFGELLTTADPPREPLAFAHCGDECRAGFVFPMIAGGEAVGALSVACADDRATFGEAEMEALATAAAIAAMSIAGIRRLDESERRWRDLADASEVAQIVASLADPREVYSALPERVARLTGASAAVIAVVDALNNCLVGQPPGYGAIPNAAEGFRLRFGTQTADVTAWSTPFHASVTDRDSRVVELFEMAPQFTSVTSAPIRVKGELAGVLLAFECPDSKDRETGRLLSAVAAQIGATLANAQLLEAVQSQARREAMLNRITTAIRESLELQEICDTAVRSLGRNLDLCRCLLAFPDRHKRVVHVAHEYCVPGIPSSRADFPLSAYGENLLRLMDQGQVFVVDDVRTDPRVASFRERILDPLEVKSLMYVPVLQDGVLVAVLSMSQCRRQRTWTAEEVALAQAVGDQIAVALRQAQLFDRQRRAVEHRDLLNRINTAVRSTLDLDTILATTVEELGRGLNVDRCFVLAPGPFPITLESTTVRFEYCRPGITSVIGLKMPIRNRAREGPVGTIEEPLVIADILETPRLVSRRKADLLALTETRGVVSVRALHGDQVLAVVEMNQCNEPRQWTPEEVELVAEVADQLAIGIHDALSFRRILAGERQWHTTFNAMTDGLAVLDPTGNVIRINESMARLCGLDDVTVAVGRPVYELLYGEASGGHDSPVERVLATGSRVQIERDIAARGVSLRESIDPILDEHDQVTGLVLVVRNVTPERDAERAIRYRNRQLGALNAIAAATTQTHDMHAIWEGAFARIVDVTGADAGAMMILDEEGEQLDPVVTHGGAARMTALLPRDPASPVCHAVLNAESPRTLEELRAATPVDAPGIEAGLLAPIRSHQRALGLLAIAYGSERQFSANDRQVLAVAGQQIGAAIENARLIAYLQQALERVQEANRLKDDFLATVSHELRTPLTAIQGWAEVLKDPEISADERAEGLDTIEAASDSLTRLISDLLEMSRIENRMLRLEFQDVDPNYPVQAALQTVRHMAEAKGVTIESELSPNLPTIVADPSRLQQVMWNLLVNAIKFTPTGGSVVVTSDLTEEKKVRIVVADTGVGIPPDFLPHVFERFRQADSSATRHYGGLGIGLSLVQSLIEAHDGTVEAASAGHGAGATFTVRLPVRKS